MVINNYKVKVSLKGFEKIINRTFLINDNVKIRDFCEGIITSMNGDLSHLFELKYNDEYYDCKHNFRISKLEFEEKDKMELIYDFGDNWIFKITIQKVIKGHNDKNFVLLKGIGKGIEDDCGGIWGLEALIENKDNDWNYDIDDFDIDEINNFLDRYYNKRK